MMRQRSMSLEALSWSDTEPPPEQVRHSSTCRSSLQTCLAAGHKLWHLWCA